MSEWWTYSIADLLLFSEATYYRLFALYNEAIWPMPLVMIAIGLTVILLTWQGTRNLARISTTLLAASWLWVAGAYLHFRLAEIHWIAHGYALLFTAQAIALLVTGIKHTEMTAQQECRLSRRLGGLLAIMIILFYPLTAAALGRPLSQAEYFGTAPDPTALVTLAWLLMTGTRRHYLLAIIPVTWMIISTVTLASLD